MAAIILEGIDNTGKTTLCRQLGTVFGASAYTTHSIGPCPGADLMWWNTKHLLGLNTRGVVIMDRCYIGELAYGPIWRNSCLLSPEATEFLDTCAKQAQVFFVLCVRPLEEVLKIYKDRQQMIPRPSAEEKLSAIQDRYEELVDERKGSVFKKVFRYDWEKSSLDTLIQSIARWGRNHLNQDLIRGGKV